MEYECGTMGAYARGKCRCDKCRAVNTARMKVVLARLARTPFDEIPHGPGGYKNYSCRCDVCGTAHSASLKAGRAKRRKDLTGCPHGTVSGYRYWGCPCGPCSEAVRADKVWRDAVAVQLNARLRGSATRHAEPWSVEDLRVLTWPDLTLPQMAVLTGRTLYAVRKMRRRVYEDPAVNELVGAVPLGPVPRARYAATGDYRRAADALRSSPAAR